MLRQHILDGTIELPNFDIFATKFGKATAEVAEKMFRASWSSYLYNKGSINLTYWAEQFPNVKGFNQVLKVLSTNGWFEAHSIPKRNWAEAFLCEDKLLQYVTPDELAHVRAMKKFAKYMPTMKQSTVKGLTRQNGKTRYTGLVRYGMKASAGTIFSYDVDMLAKYKEAIIANTTKGMRKVRDMYPEMQSDEASYDAVSAHVVQELIDSNGEYTMGNNYCDSRGRAIKEALSKVANPVGYKDFRTLLVIPEDFRLPMTEDGVFAVYLFIAELFGVKDVSVEDKAEAGRKFYEANTLPQLDLTTEEDRSELHELVWLERLYNELNQYFATSGDFYWSVPIELDASASMLSHEGLLLGDKRLLEMTNTSYTGILNDPWKFDGIGRTMFKHAATPMLYGSSRSASDLWTNNGHKYTLQQLNAYNKELANGALGLANDFKEFLIRWVKPKANMTINVYEDTFEIECNRFRNVGEITVNYDIYDSIDNRINRINHTKTKRVPDLEQFRRWFVTGLIHSIDSQVMDFVMEKLMSQYQWGIDIHDAIICTPQAASDVRNWYAEELQIIYDNRETILNKYFKSIGIGAEALEDWKHLMSKVVPVENFKASPWALK